MNTRTETRKSGRMLDWLIFVVSLVIMILLLIFLSEFFWLALPFVLTFLVRAMGVI